MKILHKAGLSFTIILMLHLACSNKKNDTAAPISITISVSADSLIFPQSGGSKTLQITTNAEYITATLPGGTSWAKCSVIGKAVYVTADSLPLLASERMLDLLITAKKGTVSQNKTIRIKQKPWKLIWEDNFNTDGLVNASNWNLVTQGSSDWNKFMTASNDLVYVQGGNLILKGRKTNTGYETGGVNSSNKFNFKYGKVEVRAKLSMGQGTWPAIWMMPQQSIYGGWPKSGEIDIMEHLNNDLKVYQVVHSHYIDNLGNKTNPSYLATPAFNVGTFNTFGIEWYPDKIDFFVNGSFTFSYPKRADIPADQLQWPFDQNFYLILNQALGGSWVGAINDAILPVQTEIDYVKVFGF